MRDRWIALIRAGAWRRPTTINVVTDAVASSHPSLSRVRPQFRGSAA